MSTIPLHISNGLFPDENMSVLDFLQFKLPPIALATRVTNIEEYLTLDDPPLTTPDIDEIRSLPIPPPDIVKGLAGSKLAAVRSIRCSHPPTQLEKRFPVWIVTFWTRVIYLRNIRQRWATAQTELQKRNHSRPWRRDTQVVRMDESTKLLEEIKNLFNIIPWGGTTKGFEVAIPMHYLSEYATREWLGSEHEDQMLDLLRRDLMDNGMTSSVDVESTQFVTKLRYAYTVPEKYAVDSEFAWVRGQGERFSNGARDLLGMIANLENKHWVAVILDFRAHVIWYGDSMGGKIPEDLRLAFEWWTHFHSGEDFTIMNLPITKQIDGYSCGLLAWNALVAFFLRNTHSLFATNEVNDERLKVLLRVFNRHQYAVRHLHSLFGQFSIKCNRLFGLMTYLRLYLHAPSMRAIQKLRLQLYLLIMSLLVRNRFQ